LAATIERYAHEYRKRTRIYYDLGIDDAVGAGLAEEYATAIFRIFHEALSNVTHHARVQKVAINDALRRGGLRWWFGTMALVSRIRRPVIQIRAGSCKYADAQAHKMVFAALSIWHAFYRRLRSLFLIC
jgi:hypothetical protein